MIGRDWFYSNVLTKIPTILGFLNLPKHRTPNSRSVKQYMSNRASKLVMFRS